MKVLISVVLAGLIYVSPVSAREVAGVDIPEQTTLAGIPLQLNGAGIRSKFFFKIYVGALYLPTPAKTAEQVYAQNAAWRVRMHFLYDEVSKEKLVAAWNDGFESNTEEAELKALQTKINAFNSLFVSAKKDDVIDIDYQPSTGTSVSINGQQRGVIDGDAFQQAVLRIWLGEVPADDSLKEGMLGERE